MRKIIAWSVIVIVFAGGPGALGYIYGGWVAALVMGLMFPLIGLLLWAADTI